MNTGMLNTGRARTGRLNSELLNQEALLLNFDETENPDLGFSTAITQDRRLRLLNRDGTFNAERQGLSYWASLSPYQALLTMPWSHFLSLIVCGYVLINLFFALVYSLCPGGLTASANTGIEDKFWQGFFFSVHTFGTIGYGNVSPVGWVANLAVTFESLLSLLCVALGTGILFARFSRPTAKVLFSEKAVIAPYQEGQALMFRLANGRRNELMEVAATVIYSQFEDIEGKATRKFYQLPLERQKVTFFSLSWTIVHPIDDESPLRGLTAAESVKRDAEILILLSGIDETFSQVVHTRTSYRAEEIVWNAKFANIFNKPDEDGRVSIDLRRLHEYEKLDAPN